MEYQRPIDLSTKTARIQQHQYGIPERDFLAWKVQRDNARTRGIDFRFTLLQWSLWWRVELKRIAPDAKRGRGRGLYVMARRGDTGAYEVGNVFAALPIDNVRDRPLANRRDAIAKVRATREANGHPLGQHLMVRGDGHPKSKPVLTPSGRFGSIALASEAHGVTRQAGFYRVKRGVWVLESA